MQHKGKQRRGTREHNFENKTGKELRIQNNKIIHQKKQNKISIKKGLAETKQEIKQKRQQHIEQVPKNESLKKMKNDKIDDQGEQKT